ncbi:hypothetical protein [Agromyces bauzanensis]|uniref:hypothetical protein n=1 Tax=Agromyces bauzanensis TaxID=1308924 RepID=UPI0016678881|nr:hypothetical protein [Agromyces bauzanensis]
MNRATQLARGAATAAVAVFLAAFSHGVAAGEAPGGVGLVFAALVALAASVAFVGRRTSPVRLALAVIVSQGAFHLLFGVGAAGGDRLVVNGTGHHQVVTVVEGAAPAVTHAAHADVAMLVAHALAAGLTILYLLAVEAAAWRSLTGTARRLVGRLTGATTVVPVEVPVPRPAVVGRPLLLRSRLRYAGLRYRGPPALLAFA